ncbi:MAG: FAD-dependent oxidoreductase [Ignavibacteriales bacterium]|nr:FAD-dependent oxidoreductase [Ignavibacteriales bacterium]
MIPQNPVIVIGGNAAGAAAAAKAARTNPAARVILFEKSPFISTGTCELPYLFSGEIDDYRKLVFFSDESFRNQKRVEVYSSTEVVAIDTRKSAITAKSSVTGSSQVFPFSKLIVATGSKARVLAGYNTQLKNLFTLKSVPDYLRWQEYNSLSNPKTIAVIGAGFVGLELVTALTKAGKEVLLFEFENRPIPAFETELSSFASELLKQNSIAFYPGSNNIQFVISDGRITKIRSGSRLIEVDVVFMALGFEPETTLLTSAGIKTGITGAVPVSTKLLTALPNIFAAGDAIECTDYITKNKVYYPSAVTAQITGHIAGENAAGGNVFFQPVIKNIALPFFNKFFLQIGCTALELKDYAFRTGTVQDISLNRVKVMPGASSIFSKVHFDLHTGHILGASFFGDADAGSYADIISLAIKHKIPVQALSDVSYNYTPELSPFIHPLSKIGKLSSNLNNGVNNGRKT